MTESSKLEGLRLALVEAVALALKGQSNLDGVQNEQNN
jgi:hypothetical protein